MPTANRGRKSGRAVEEDSSVVLYMNAPPLTRTLNANAPIGGVHRTWSGMENVRASKASKVAAVFMVAWSFVGITFIATAEQASARTIIVGGKERWHFGFNYTDWALKAAPFHVNDTLVFKYVRPNATIFHNVLKLPNRRAYEACDFKRAKLLADVNGGQGSGFAYVLNQTRPIYFGCGIHDGRHCNLGLMKFYVKPVGNSTSA